MSNLWWLEPRWKETMCARCGQKIWPEGDPDHGVCHRCWHEEQHYREQEARELEEREQRRYEEQHYREQEARELEEREQRRYEQQER